ncbi:MAG: tRNA (adenosine(37)-N6)-threonylcarbamoyltransferase complex transferase subunit TsaD [Candidatus Zixiibacteriota bacterium]|nr:MAG: tRNA (adenosine(37)-N6)-threonylcarbamoyltransferase complex transferase subunit TsaD [candidate division Zixibacteria bacterium]
MLTLGIETSCDETSAAVIKDGAEVLSNIVLSQAIHGRFGGVVPELASRAHIKTVVPIYRQALEEAGVTIDRVGLVAATMGPGLVGPLLVGLTFAKGLAFANSIPFVAVNHIEGHLAANYLEHPDMEKRHLSLIVSGGHTLLVEVDGFGSYDVIGQTKDDAVGEAFDKVAKIMGMGYPGGEKLDKLAQSGNARFHRFPRAMMKEEGYQFSYSGLKTAVALHIGKLSEGDFERQKADLAASFQEAAVEVLVEKTIRAAGERNIRDIALAGGVAANSRLRSMFAERIDKNRHRLFWPPVELCTDNAAMIAAAGYYRYRQDGPSELITNAVPYLRLSEM